MTEQSAREQLAAAAVDTRRVAFIAAAVLLFLGASMGILAFVFFSVAPNYKAPARKDFPQPRLQAHPAADLQQYLARQRSELSSYRWASSDHSLVAIPIERAMEITAQRGAMGYQPIAASPPADRSQPGAKP